MRRCIIGLVGPSGSGKTTVGKCLASEYGFVRIHSGQPIKNAFCAAFRVDQDWLDKHIDEPAPFLGFIPPRVILEHWGYDLHRMAPQALPRALDEHLAARPRKARVLVDGIRQQPLADMVHLWNGTMIRIRPYKPLLSVEDAPGEHLQTEVEADYEIGAGGRVDKLLDQLRKLLDDSILSK